MVSTTVDDDCYRNPPQYLQEEERSRSDMQQNETSDAFGLLAGRASASYLA